MPDNPFEDLNQNVRLPKFVDSTPARSRGTRRAVRSLFSQHPTGRGCRRITSPEPARACFGRGLVILVGLDQRSELGRAYRSPRRGARPSRCRGRRGGSPGAPWPSGGRGRELAGAIRPGMLEGFPAQLHQRFDLRAIVSLTSGPQTARACTAIASASSTPNTQRSTPLNRGSTTASSGRPRS